MTEIRFGNWHDVNVGDFIISQLGNECGWVVEELGKDDTAFKIEQYHFLDLGHGDFEFERTETQMKAHQPLIIMDYAPPRANEPPLHDKLPDYTKFPF